MRHWTSQAQDAVWNALKEVGLYERTCPWIQNKKWPTMYFPHEWVRKQMHHWDEPTWHLYVKALGIGHLAAGHQDVFMIRDPRPTKHFGNHQVWGLLCRTCWEDYDDPEPFPWPRRHEVHYLLGTNPRPPATLTA